MRRRAVPAAALWILTLAAVFSCEQEKVLLPDRNLPPETIVTQAPAESTQTNFKVHMYWYGQDSDGIVVSFRYAIDDTVDIGGWRRTSQTDTVFVFTADDPLLRYHEFFIAAIDNEGKADPTPAIRKFFARDDYMPEVWMVDWPYCLVSDTGDTLACLPPSSSQDTLRMDGEMPILFAWQGQDRDGIVTAYAYKLDNDAYRWVSPETTTAVYPPPRDLRSGLHSFYITARDDAHAELTPAFRYRFVVNFDPNSTIDSLYYIAFGTTDLVPVDFEDDNPDTLPDGCSIVATWHVDDADGEVIKSLVQLRGPDLLAQQEWSSGWMDYPDSTRWQSKKLEGTLDDFFILKVFGLDDRLRSEGTPDQTQFMVNFPPRIDTLGVSVKDSVLYSGGTPTDTLYVARFAWAVTDPDNQVGAQIRFFYVLDGRLILPSDADSRNLTYRRVLSEGSHTFEVRAHNYRYDARVRYGSKSVTVEIGKSLGWIAR